MPTVKETLAELNAHERECTIRYEYIEKRLEMLLWGVYPFILGSIVFAAFI